MVKTILLLILALIIVPVAAYYFDDPLNEHQRTIILNGLYFALGTAALTFITAEITRNCSQIDKLWSILPVIYIWYIAYESDWNTRIVLMAVLITCWGARLTFNFARRGGYSWKFWTGEEDYRWEILRQNPALNKRWKWTLFNFGFISFYQSLLIYSFTFPAIMATQGNDTPLNWMDFVCMTVFILLLIIETVADQQQYDYQTEKYRRKNAGEPLTGMYAQGFISRGLFKYVRHPNYAAEQGMWLVIYFFGVAATWRWLNWSGTGIVLLLLLFNSSADFSEGISLKKYPAYKNYVKKVGRFFPKLW